MEVIIKEAGNRLDKSLADLTELSRSQAAYKALALATQYPAEVPCEAS